MIVEGERLSTFRIVSLPNQSQCRDHRSTIRRRRDLILSLTLISPSTLFHKLTMSSLCRTLIVHPHISGQSLPSRGSSQLAGTDESVSSGRRHPSNWSPIIASTRSSHTRSATPFLRRIIHFPPVMLRGSSQTGRRMPELNRR